MATLAAKTYLNYFIISQYQFVLVIYNVNGRFRLTSHTPPLLPLPMPTITIEYGG